MITYYDEGYSGWSELCDLDWNKKLKNISLKKAIQTHDFLKEKYIEQDISKYEQKKDLTFSFPKEFIFFPLQKIEDSVMVKSYMAPIKLIKSIVKILNDKKIPLLVKKHPRCTNSELSELLELYKREKKIILYKGSIHDAIKKSKTVYVINSGVGFESLLHLKPVVTFGRSDYMAMTKNVKDLKEIEQEAFYSLSKDKKDKIKKFLHFYVNKISVCLDDEKKLEKILNKYFS